MQVRPWDRALQSGFRSRQYKPERNPNNINRKCLRPGNRLETASTMPLRWLTPTRGWSTPGTRPIPTQLPSMQEDPIWMGKSFTNGLLLTKETVYSRIDSLGYDSDCQLVGLLWWASSLCILPIDISEQSLVCLKKCICPKKIFKILLCVLQFFFLMSLIEFE